MSYKITLINGYELADWIENASRATNEKAHEYLKKGDRENAKKMSGKLLAYYEVLTYMQKMTVIQPKEDNH